MRVRAPREPLVDKDDCSVVLHVSDDATDCLVDRPGRLLIVPVLAFKGPQLSWNGSIAAASVQVVLLQDDLGIGDHRVRNADDHDAAGGVVGEV